MTSELKPWCRHENIYLIYQGEHEDITWCEDSAPSGYEKPEDVQHYIRADKAIPIAELEALPEETLYLTGIVGEDYIKASDLQTLLEKYK